MFKESLKMSWKNIKSNKMRSFLTTLGILIGVTAIISLTTLMTGAINESNKQFEDLGAGKLSISVPGTLLKQGLTDKDIEELAKIDNVANVSPNISITIPVVGNNEVLEDVSVEGRDGAYFETNKDSLIRGRGLNILDVNNKNNVCVISKDLEEKLFIGENSLNKKVVIEGISYTVVGVIDTEINNATPMMALMMGDSEGTVMIPYKQALYLTGSNSINSLEVTVDDTDKTSSTVSAIEGFLNQKFNDDEDAYNVVNLESILDVMKTMQSMMKGILIGIASISLLVGGIGIMNMMIVSVTERTIEIGLRKALGAQPKHIQLQFIIEAIILSLLGGIAGVILGVSVSLIGFNLLNITPVISMGSISLGVGFSALIGIIFGWAPAKKASELNPIDALRSL